MSGTLSEKRKSFTTMDEEEDALLNEAISCSRNMDLKVEEEVKVEEKKLQPRKSKMWCDMTSDSSSNMSDLSLSNGKIDLSTSGENVNVSLVNGKESDKSLIEEQIKADDKSKLTDVLDIKIEATNSKTSDEELNIKQEIDDDVAETNGRNGKRTREGEDNDDYSKVPKNRRNSASSSSSTLSSVENPRRKPLEFETDPVLLARRQKDIDYGKNTVGYDLYIQQIPKHERAKDHPRTPPMHLKCSRRGWDGMVRLWRKQLHFWDPKEESEGSEDNFES